MHEIIGQDLDVPGPFYWARYVVAQGPVANKLVLDGSPITLRGPDAWLAPAGRPWSRIRVPTGATILVGTSPDEPMPGVPPWYADGTMPVNQERTLSSLTSGSATAPTDGTKVLESGALETFGIYDLRVTVGDDTAEAGTGAGVTIEQVHSNGEGGTTVVWSIFRSLKALNPPDVRVRGIGGTIAVDTVRVMANGTITGTVSALIELEKVA